MTVPSHLKWYEVVAGTSFASGGAKGHSSSDVRVGPTGIWRAARHTASNVESGAAVARTRSRRKASSTTGSSAGMARTHPKPRASIATLSVIAPSRRADGAGERATPL